MRVLARVLATGPIVLIVGATLSACQGGAVSRGNAEDGRSTPGRTATRNEPEIPDRTDSRTKGVEFPPRLKDIYDHFLRAQLYAREAVENTDEARQLREKELEELRQASRLEPGSGYLHALIADRLAVLSQTEEAEREIELALKRDPGVVLAYLVRGKIAWQQKEHDEAIEAFQKCLELDPKEMEAKSHLVRLYQQMADEQLLEGKYDEAIDLYEQVLELAPYHQSVYLNMAYAYSRQEKYDEAVALYEKLRGAHYTRQGKAEVEMFLGETLYRAGRLKLA